MSKYMSNLKDLDLGAYGTPELIELARRIAAQTGVDGAWKIIEAAGDQLKAEKSDSYVAAVRVDPDDPQAVDVMMFNAPTGGPDRLVTVLIPLLAALQLHASIVGTQAGQASGLGPIGYTELLASKIRELHKRKFGDSGPPIGFGML